MEGTDCFESHDLLEWSSEYSEFWTTLLKTLWETPLELSLLEQVRTNCELASPHLPRSLSNLTLNDCMPGAQLSAEEAPRLSKSRGTANAQRRQRYRARRGRQSALKRTAYACKNHPTDFSGEYLINPRK